MLQVRAGGCEAAQACASDRPCGTCLRAGLPFTGPWEVAVPPPGAASSPERRAWSGALSSPCPLLSAGAFPRP